MSKLVRNVPFFASLEVSRFLNLILYLNVIALTLHLRSILPHRTTHGLTGRSLLYSMFP